jgi:alanyl-tRNA synthetase
MNHKEIRKKFRTFFEKKGHKNVPSSSLVPDDSSVLFTTAGMQQFKSYYTEETDAEKDFKSLNVVSTQKCVRTSDIDEVGDESHLTFFEMLGSFSFGGYFKEDAIKWAHEFITKEMGLKIDFVSVFGGEDDLPADAQSEAIWKSIDKNIVIKKAGRSDNFWGPTGDEGPCGPTTEIYVNGVEIWNIVFNEYYCNKDKSLRKLETPGIDTGMGLERLAMVVQKKETIFDTDLFDGIVHLIPHGFELETKRIIADHVRSIAFLLSDGVKPSNKEQGYVLRRLIRRIVVHEHLAEEVELGFGKIFETLVAGYKEFYPDLNRDLIIKEFNIEKDKFLKTLKAGLKELAKLEKVDAESAFKLYESFGLPYEIIKELGKKKADTLNRTAFDEEFKKHQEKSRAGAGKKFGGHGLLMDTGELKATDEEELEKATKLHTASHLLHASLRKVLGETVQQAGSDITSDRLRFDFTFPRKVNPEELTQVENRVNAVIKEEVKVSKEDMSYEDAIKTGALSFFKLKYPSTVNVYSIGDFSKELCGGPHIESTGIIGRLKITKEESASAGIRRIRATINN